MCIVVDANCLTHVFKKYSDNHLDFKPVLDWIIDGKGKFVFGGTKYIEELGVGYLRLFTDLSRVRKTVKIDTQEVDDKTEWAAEQIQHNDFDDPHIVALLLVSGCKLVCSRDARSYPYLTHKLFFSPASKRPKIYSSSKNADLLKDKNIAERCRPSNKLTIKEKERLTL